MDITGKMAADVRQIVIKSNEANDGREANIDLAVSVKQDEAAKKWGEEFATLAFSSLRPREGTGDEGDGLAFLQDKIKPAKKRFVCGMHRIDIDGETIDAQPELTAIDTVDGEARVIAHLRIPIDVGRKRLVSALSEKVGSTVKIDFAVQQGKLPLGERGAGTTAEK